MNQFVNEIIRVAKEKHLKDISMYNHSFIEKTIESRYLSIGLENMLKYRNYLEESDEEAEKFFVSLNNTFSRFFREILTYAVLEKKILPSIIYNKSSKREIRIWSAGSSSGQEAYSIAILLSDIISTENKKCKFRIFATDISQEAIDIAKAGSYNEDALQNVRIKHLKEYFIQDKNTYRVVPKLKENIDFSMYNLLDGSSANPPDSIYGDFDIVFCSNLLFYYNDEIRKSIILKIKNSIACDGYLITGEVESAFVEQITKLKKIDSSVPVFQNRKG